MVPRACPVVAASWVSTWFCNIDVSVPELSKQRGLFKARLRRILFYLKQNINKETFPFKGTVHQHFLNNPGLQNLFLSQYILTLNLRGVESNAPLEGGLPGAGGHDGARDGVDSKVASVSVKHIATDSRIEYTCMVQHGSKRKG